MKVKEIAAAIERLAPLEWQDSYDNAGLQIGSPEADAKAALLCLDVTEEVLSEAAKLGANLVIAHHPLLFRPLKRISDCNQAQRCARLAVKNDIAVYAAHTNLDNARGGVNFKIAEKLGLNVEGFLRPTGDDHGSGIIGSLPSPVEANAFLTHVKGVFGAECLMHNGLLQRPVQTVALCGGAGDFLLDDAIAAHADAFITGEMHYHIYAGHDGEIQIAVAGHYQTEKFTVEIFRELLASACPGLKTFATTIDTNPIKYL